MMQSKRMHPLMIASSILSSIKDLFFLILIFFVINIASTSTWVVIGRYILIAIFILLIITAIVEWFRTSYEVKEKSIVIRQGAFVIKQRYLPFDRVQNVKTNTPFYFRFFNATSLVLETGSGGDDASFTFPALYLTEAKKLESIIDRYRKNDLKIEQGGVKEDQAITETSQTENELRNNKLEQKHPERKIHFTPTRKDVLKASILSASYIVLVPILLSIFQQIDSVYDISTYLEEGYQFLSNSWMVLAIAITLLILASIAFGVIQTFLKYGKYEIASDEERIYISQGVLSEKHFSIRKKNVQAIEMRQSILKRLLGLTSVKLISAGEMELSGDPVNSLYPFLPTKRALSLVEELLPGFEITTEMKRMPTSSLVARMLHVPWIWIIATGVILYFFPQWWWTSIILLILTIVVRYLDYRFAKFTINGSFIQLQTGGWEITTLVTQRNKAIEFSIEENIIQRRLGVITIKTSNRGKPVYVKTLADIPAPMAKEAYYWYKQ
ncbi:PH domain-containing protein [Oceanobacillus sp. 1P07AA]|uniref:PH domain-containing protein n=1 Tax=Oceanobacillus sp. 1P07AA TaxID=3132293 RepID=UPI0039A5E71B